MYLQKSYTTMSYALTTLRTLKFMNKERKNKLIKNAIPTLFKVPNTPEKVTLSRQVKGRSTKYTKSTASRKCAKEIETINEKYGTSETVSIEREHRILHFQIKMYQFITFKRKQAIIYVISIKDCHSSCFATDKYCCICQRDLKCVTNAPPSLWLIGMYQANCIKSDRGSFTNVCKSPESHFRQVSVSASLSHFLLRWDGGELGMPLSLTCDRRSFKDRGIHEMSPV